MDKRATRSWPRLLPEGAGGRGRPPYGRTKRHSGSRGSGGCFSAAGPEERKAEAEPAAGRGLRTAPASARGGGAGPACAAWRAGSGGCREGQPWGMGDWGPFETSFSLIKVPLPMWTWAQISSTATCASFPVHSSSATLRGSKRLSGVSQSRHFMYPWVKIL